MNKDWLDNNIKVLYHSVPRELKLDAVRKRQILNKIKEHISPEEDLLPSTVEIFREKLEADQKLKSAKIAEENKQKSQKIEAAARKKWDDFLAEQRKDEWSYNSMPAASLKWKWHIPGIFYKGIAAVLLVSLCLWLSYNSKPSLTVAKIVSSYDTVWDRTLKTQTEGIPVTTEPIKILSGVVELEFLRGAKVQLQAPAELKIRSDNEADLVQGKLHATIPPGATGFTIHTPHVTIVDHGTEFGVEVKANGDSECHVFEGKVKLLPAGFQHTAYPYLITGQAKRISREGAIMTDIAIDEENYIAKIPQPIIQEITEKKWGSCSFCLKQQELKLDLPFAIESINNITFVDHRQVSFEQDTPPSPHLSQDSSAYFSDNESYLVINPKQSSLDIDENSSRSLALWVKLDELETQTIFHTPVDLREFYESYFEPVNRLYVQKKNDTAIFLKYDFKVEKKQLKDQTRTLLCQLSDHDNKWTHIALTIENNHCLRLYVNGLLVDTQFSPQGFNIIGDTSEEFIFGNIRPRQNNFKPVIKNSIDGFFVSGLSLYNCMLTEDDVAYLAMRDRL